jgi:hypothetical protein
MALVIVSGLDMDDDSGSSGSVPNISKDERSLGDEHALIDVVFHEAMRQI